jgi:hypothetical protein
MTLQLTKPPSVDTGMLIRRSPHDVFEALADPSITTRFWYTNSSGRMEQGAELIWEWRPTAFREWSGCGRSSPTVAFASRGRDMTPHPTTFEFLFVAYENDATYVRITETGFQRGQPCARVDRRPTFLLSALKAALEHDIPLKVTMDALPPNLELPS